MLGNCEFGGFEISRIALMVLSFNAKFYYVLDRPVRHKYCSNEAKARHLNERSRLSMRSKNNATLAIFQQ